MLHAWVIQGNISTCNEVCDDYKQYIYHMCEDKIKGYIYIYICTCDWCTMYYVHLCTYYILLHPLKTFRSYPSFTEFWSKSTQRLPGTQLFRYHDKPGDGLTKEPMQAEDVLSLGSAFKTAEVDAM